MYATCKKSPSSMFRTAWAVFVLLALLVTASTSMAREVTSGPFISITPEDYSDVGDGFDRLRGSFYNPTGVVIGSTLHLYVQGGMFEGGSGTPWDDCPSDEIIRFSAPFTSAGVRGPFTAGNRISPCEPMPPGEELHYGLGSVVQKPWDGQYWIFLDRAEGDVFSEGDFKEILIGTSSDGVDFTYPSTINPLVKQSLGLSIIDVTLTAGSDRLWGLFKFGTTAADQVGRMQVLPSQWNARGFIVQIQSGGSWVTVANDGSLNAIPDNVWPYGQPNSIVETGGLIQVWAHGDSNFATEGCEDPYAGGGRLSFAEITATSIGDLQDATSVLPDWPLPSTNKYGRMFPYRIDLGAEKLLFLTSADRACEENQPAWPGWSPFRGMEIVMMALDEPPTGTSCVPTSTTSCLQDGRFEVEVEYGTGSHGSTLPFSDKSGFFTFGNPNSVEAGVKILDGRSVNGHWWVFHGSLTSVEYEVTVTDTTTGAVKTYLKPASGAGPLCGGSDTRAFADANLGAEVFKATDPPQPAWDLGGKLGGNSCTAAPGRLCLLGDRFEVKVRKSGLDQNGAELNDGNGTFWFTDPASIEVPVKIIDGTAVNGKYWVFYGSLTDQAYEVVVTDTATRASKVYSSGNPLCGAADTNAF